MGVFMLSHWLIVAVFAIFVSFGLAIVARLCIPLFRIIGRVRERQLRQKN